MAEERQQPLGTGNNYQKGLNKDLLGYLMSPSQWTSAKNMVINTQSGDELSLSTESATQFCVNLPYTLIGAIPMDGAQWCVFTTDNTNSEIGIVDTDNCTYTTFSNTPCLNFNTANLITGAARRNFDCGFNIYWSDGARNPDRYINTNPNDTFDNIWVQNCSTVAGCTTCTNTTTLDCDKIRIAPLMTIPCLTLSKSTGSGTLENGTYQVAVAYAINGIKVTNYVQLSNPQSVFSHNNEAGAVNLTITGADTTHFTEMLVTVISFVNNQLVAKRLGYYSTRESIIYISEVNKELVTEDIANIPLQATPIEKSDSIWSVNTYLFRSGVYELPDFNYQPLANQISTKWVLAEYPEQYYKQGGNNYSYIGDEQYCFYIRWVYNDGAKSSSYHIPGRAFNPVTDFNWEIFNTAQVGALGGGVLPDGGVIIASGSMGYWESTERYPDNKASVWNSNVPGHPEWDLCGQVIRHHKFPDQTVNPVLTHFTGSNTIRILGVQFSNIKTPVDNTGSPITNIVGYEILRGSREGNKTILAKGMVNFMRAANLPGSAGGQVLFQNYPANDLRDDYYLTDDPGFISKGGIDGNPHPLRNSVKFDTVSFHSPDTSFQHPYLGSPKLKIYQELDGFQLGYFETPYQHPLFKTPTNFDSVISDITGVVSSVGAVIGAVGGINNYFTGTPDLPVVNPLQIDPSYPDGPFGALGTVVYAAQIAYNIVMTVVQIPIQIKVVAEQMMRVISGLIPAKQYARQFNGHAYYNIPTYLGFPGILQTVNDYEYIEGNVQTFLSDEVNNLYRNNYVILNLGGGLPTPGLPDTTRYTLSQTPASGDQSQMSTPTSAYYAGLKVDLPAQYGQVQSPKEELITNCVYQIDPTLLTQSTPVLFGGDTYVTRYTEKNPFFLFNDWLRNVPEDFAYDYRNYINVPYPGYWMDNTKIYASFLSLASDYRRLDAQTDGGGIGLSSKPFYVDSGYFYLFCNGVRDFYVESDVNVGYRDWGDEIGKRFYDPYGFTDLSLMFRSDIIKSDILYKYDYSLSVSKFYTQYISFGSMQEPDYDPILAYTCFDYYPRRVIYSLPQTEELKVDNWRQFLPNNFYDFYTPIRAIKSISKTGALFMLDEQSPVEFLGTQVLQQGEAGKIAITVGDGGLFNQGLQNVVNSDKGINYGACRSRYSAINTPHGLFWVDQKSGKVFNYTGKLDEISNLGLKYWFAQYLPSYLLSQFPDYPYSDNPVIGVGVQTTYDEVSDVLYVSKRDFRLKDQYIGQVYLLNGQFYLAFGVSTKGDLTPTARFPIDLTNPTYFDDASWTVSYSCNERFWISYHSWIPELILTARRHPITSKSNQLWLHNNRTDLFSNYYNIDYPTNIEYIINTSPDTTTTLRNIQYYLDAYEYYTNGWDRKMLWSSNWDNLLVYNNEQISGLLVLNPRPANPYDELNFPAISASFIDVMYSYREGIYRVNSLVDVVRDRGEYSGTPTQLTITDFNGVDIIPNPLAINTNKPDFQRKKFRSEFNRILLQKNHCGNVRYQFYLTRSKLQKSER